MRTPARLSLATAFGLFLWLSLIGVWLSGAGSLASAQQAPAAREAVPAAWSLRDRVAAYVQSDNAKRRTVLETQLKAAGLPYVVEPFEGRAGQPGANVVVQLGDGAREILLVAHYDAVVMIDGRLSHGVVDNAASVVALIETARRLKADKLRHRIRILFTDQEELGLVGAGKWIEAHGLSRVAAVINADVGGYGDTMMYGENNGPQSAGLLRAVREVCAARALACVGYPQYPPSDDRAFVAAGAATLSLGFQDAVGAHQMWLALNGGMSALARGFAPKVFQLIHTPGDRIEEIDPATIALAAETYAALVRKLDAELGPR
jgi:Zn-dependent M28 family amino/carboxypeptidase